ncbi:MAG: SDR family NAD(P)-dependent oxidoreductase [Oligoflexia bacterium]|nr:SDR family NAD(P)-dependent oxidoreductase [Oligoflexia bacterium]
MKNKNLENKILENKNLENKNLKYALVTGASSGLGELFALKLAEENWNLILVARSEDKLKSLAFSLSNKFSIKVETISLDLSEQNSASKLFAIIQSKSSLASNIELVINNAGIGIVKYFDQSDANELTQMMNLNMITPTLLSLYFIKHMKENNISGTILNLSSMAAFNPIPKMSCYAATKSFILSLSMAIDYELRELEADLKIKVLTLCPGPAETNFFNRANYSSKKILMKVQSAEEVVSTGMKAIKNKTSVSIVGTSNKILVFISKFFPSNLINKMTSYFMGYNR